MAWCFWQIHLLRPNSCWIVWSGIDLHVNANKMDYMCFSQRGSISTLKDGSETNGQVHLHRKQRLINRKWHQYMTSESMYIDWLAIDHMKVRLTGKNKTPFSPVVVVSLLLFGCTTLTVTKCIEKKLEGNCTRILKAILNKSWDQHPTNQQL